MKKWLYSVVMAGLIAVLLIPLMGFSSHEKDKQNPHYKPDEITLESGGLGVPYGVDPTIYREPKDGIISGAAGCEPDLHEFNKNTPGPGEHIVFPAGVKALTTHEKAAPLLDKFIYMLRSLVVVKKL
ncbi:hypothetical protein [Bacillus sp. V5-8f]|uniref:hypothetical protein n=1 Tax=Bacillus sp. V5-8f TaxID=2053044 RepID=UPI000C75B1C9|nr:hypothetical protein [Bacillus sp. V5-8f]PLT33916.1 hypothetical protein CUU64_12475 [Bacillus sp. V5-8f]